MKIPFKLVKELIRSTLCPNGKGLKVDSINCRNCKHYVTTDIEKQEIECNFDLRPTKSTPVDFNGNTFHLSVEAGCLNLVLTDKEKEKWFIVGINKSGELELYSGLSDDIGLNVDPNGTVETISV